MSKIRGLMGSSVEVTDDLIGNTGVIVTSRTSSAVLVLTPSARQKLVEALGGTIPPESVPGGGSVAFPEKEGDRGSSELPGAPTAIPGHSEGEE